MTREEKEHKKRHTESTLLKKQQDFEAHVKSFITKVLEDPIMRVGINLPHTKDHIHETLAKDLKSLSTEEHTAIAEALIIAIGSPHTLAVNVTQIQREVAIQALTVIPFRTTKFNEVVDVYTNVVSSQTPNHMSQITGLLDAGEIFAPFFPRSSLSHSREGLDVKFTRTWRNLVLYDPTKLFRLKQKDYILTRVDTIRDMMPRGPQTK